MKNKLQEAELRYIENYREETSQQILDQEGDVVLVAFFSGDPTKIETVPEIGDDGKEVLVDGEKVLVERRTSITRETLLMFVEPNTTKWTTFPHDAKWCLANIQNYRDAVTLLERNADIQ